jgi:hypothetical protein
VAKRGRKGNLKGPASAGALVAKRGWTPAKKECDAMIEIEVLGFFRERRVSYGIE